MDAHHRFKNRADGVDVRLLAAGIPDPCVQDVPPVQDQDEHVDFGGLQTLLGRSLLTKEMEARGGGCLKKVVFKGVYRVWATANNGPSLLAFYSFLACGGPTYTPHGQNKTTTLRQHHSCTTRTREPNTRVVLHIESGDGRRNTAGGGLGLGGGGCQYWVCLGDFGSGVLCGAAAYHSARGPKVFTY